MTKIGDLREHLRRLYLMHLGDGTIPTSARFLFAKLNRKLAKADEGSLFDLKSSSRDDIAAVITDGTHVSFKKAKDIAAAITARLKRKSQKPAG